MSLAAMVAATFHVAAGLLVVGLVLLVFAIYVIVDMARRPAWQWQQAGSNKALWLVIEIVVVVLPFLSFLSWIVGILYLAIVRPKLVAAGRQGQSIQGNWPGGGWPPQGPPPGLGWPPQGQPPAPGTWPPAAPPPPPGAPAYPGTGGEPAPAPAPAPFPAGGPPPYPATGAPPAYPNLGAGTPTPPPSPEPAPSRPLFGWYPDPSGAHELRYWDGMTWTEHVSDGGHQATDPLPG